ncbi:hypothetical protein HanXRQr2_Chr07g0302081 [Helianthus annuus]|uniref:Uncharacterized protein n=1 Tax=Helianthus annuus TaxID=4232 RepID=A0A9K3NG71_HELAN|nr:hypothetical protein HanXRQr2_Chr07g0302081 [Helianthus annuus]KAJ0905297.1 hypothetical protein HanPSC8_Chr07g0292371 [Helianthus annuus]
MIHFIIRNQTSFYSRISNQTSQWNGMIHFIPLSIPLPRSFHSLIHSITTYQTDPMLKRVGNG